ncbi:MULTISPECIES: CBS domain-containing protein [Alphaproteobacteria]|uniref:CBS domain-containing protein n=1 Tax=Alphaproteobacteria TaxID=28211 RepID=UPI003A8F418A
MNMDSILRGKGRDVVAINEALSLGEAAKLMDAHGIGALLVCDSHDRPTGVVCERDIIRELALNGAAGLGRPISGAITAAFLTAAPEDLTETVMVRMTERRVRHLPVLDQGRVVGIVSIGDLVKARIAEVEAETDDLRNYIHH